MAKQALYYVLTRGYHAKLFGRIVAVTSEMQRSWSKEPTMLNGRDEEHGTATRVRPRDVAHRFVDLDEVRRYEAKCDELATARAGRESRLHAEVQDLQHDLNAKVRELNDIHNTQAAEALTWLKGAD